MALKTIWNKAMMITDREKPSNPTPPMLSKVSPRLRLRERDVAIVEAVHRLRVLSTEQIAQLFFPTSEPRVSTACRTRLRRLADAGLLERAEQEQRRTDGRRPYLYMLTEGGAQLLVDELDLEPENIDWKPAYNDVRWPFLRHQLAINDAYVAFSLAAPRIGWSLEGWTDDRILRSMHTERVSIPGHTEPVVVIPDAYFRLVGPGGTPKLHFFLEIDRATMTVAARSRLVKSWQDKIRACGGRPWGGTASYPLPAKGREHHDRFQPHSPAGTTVLPGLHRRNAQCPSGPDRQVASGATRPAPERRLGRPECG